MLCPLHTVLRRCVSGVRALSGSLPTTSSWPPSSASEAASLSSPTASDDVSQIAPSSQQLHKLRWRHGYPRELSGFMVFEREERQRLQAERAQGDTSKATLLKVWKTLCYDEQRSYNESAKRITASRLKLWAVRMRSEGKEDTADLLLRYKPSRTEYLQKLQRKRDYEYPQYFKKEPVR